MTDRHGEQLQFDQYGLWTSRLDRVGNTTAFSYIDLDSDGVPDSLSPMVDAAGRTTTFNYVDGRLDAITDFAGRVTERPVSSGPPRSGTRPNRGKTRPAARGPSVARGRRSTRFLPPNRLERRQTELLGP